MIKVKEIERIVCLTEETTETIYALGAEDLIVGISVGYFIYITLVYVFHRKQFRAADANFGLRIEPPVFTLLRKIVNPKYQSYLTTAVILFILV